MFQSFFKLLDKLRCRKYWRWMFFFMNKLHSIISHSHIQYNESLISRYQITFTCALTVFRKKEKKENSIDIFERVAISRYRYIETSLSNIVRKIGNASSNKRKNFVERVLGRRLSLIRRI